MPDEPQDGGRLSSISARRVTGDVLGQIGLRLLNLFLGVGVTILVVRALGDEGFGRWSTILAVLQIVGYLGELGLEQIAVRRAAGDERRAPRWLGALVTLRLALAVPSFLACAAVLVGISSSAEMTTAALILAAGIPLSAISSMRAVFQLRVRNSIIAATEVVNGLAWAAAVVVIFLVGGGLVPFALGFVGAQMLSTALVAVLAWRTMRPEVDDLREAWRELIRVGVPVAVATLLMYSYGRIDQVLVFEINGERAAGLYGAAYRILDRAQFIPGAIVGTLFPLIAAAHGVNPDRVRRLAQASFEVILTLAMPVFAFACVAGDPTVRTLFGEEFAESATAFAILMAVFVATSLGYLVGYLVLVLGLQRQFIAWALAGLVVNVGLNLVLLPVYGFVAAAWVTVATEIVVIGLGLRATMRGIEHRLALGRAARVVAVSAVMAGAVLLARAADAPFAVLVVVGAVVYPAALLGSRTWRPQEFRTAMGR